MTCPLSRCPFHWVELKKRHQNSELLGVHETAFHFYFCTKTQENPILLQHHEFDSQTLQSLALQVGCRAKYLKNEVQVAYNNIRDVSQRKAPDPAHYKVPLTVLTCIANTVKIAKELGTWLDK